MAGGPVRVPLRGRRLKRWNRRHNTTHGKICCLGEQTMANLKGRRLLLSSAAAPTERPTS